MEENYLHLNGLIINCSVLERYEDGKFLIYAQGRIAIAELLVGTENDFIPIHSVDIQNQIDNLLTLHNLS